MTFEKQYTDELKWLPVYIQCTWVAGFLYPRKVKYEQVISYNRTLLDSKYSAYKMKSTYKWLNKRVVGRLTGSYHVREDGVIWLEVEGWYLNRTKTVWMRELDIWFAAKDAIPNKNDWEFIPYSEDGKDGNDNKDKKTFFSLLLSAVALLNFIS